MDFFVLPTKEPARPYEIQILYCFRFIDRIELELCTLDLLLYSHDSSDVILCRYEVSGTMQFSLSRSPDITF